jgi:hypothetical protein
MAVYTPPTENIPIFDNSVFPSSSGTALTIATGEKYFLSYPVAQGTEIFPSNVTFQSTITDSSGDVGTAGQLLSSTGTGTTWTNAGGITGNLDLPPPYGLLTDTITESASHVAGTDINLYGTTTDDDILIGSTLGSGHTLRLCNTTSGSSGGSVHCCNVGFDGVNINNATNPTTGNMKIGNAQSTGTLFLGGGTNPASRTTGPIIIGSDIGATGGINIGTNTGLTAPTASTLNIGNANYTTNIVGPLVGDNGCISGRTNYSLLNTSTFPFTLSTNVNTEYFVYIIGTSVGVTLTIPSSYPVGQRLIIKNGTAIATPITVNFAPSVISLFSNISATATASLQYGDILDIIWNGAIWFQQTSTSEFSSITSRGALSGASLSLGGGNITSVGTINTSSSITSASGGITATLGSISANTSGSISQTGIITGSSLISPSLNAASDSTNVGICTTQVGGTLSIGTGARGTGATISIGTGGGATAFPINIGGSGSTTTLNGITTTAIGTIAGKTAYLEYNTTSALPTIDCSTLNLNVTILFFSGSIPSGTCTLTNIQENQIINLKNWNNNATPIPFALNQSTPTPIKFYPYGTDNDGTGLGVTSFSIAQGESISMQKASGKIYQFSSGSTFINGINLPIRALTPSINQLGYTNSASNSAIVSVPANTLTTLLTTGTVLPLGTLLVTFNITVTFTPATNSSNMTFSFTLSSGTVMVGVPANTIMTLIGNFIRSTFTYTIPVTTTATANDASITISGTTPVGTTASIPIGSARISWVKIA